MTNTKNSFDDKWKNNPELVFAETIKEGSELFSWILNRNGFVDSQSLKGYLKDKKRILDAGCGNGRVTALLRNHSNSDKTEVVGIDLVSVPVAEKNLQSYPNVKFFPKDLLKDDLSDLGLFDFIYCQEVLHHTADPGKTFQNLRKILKPGGEIAIYVYKKKAPIREFVDDYIRDRISGLSYEEAMAACNQITQLGKMLSESKVKITVPEVSILEIKKGEYDLQRFIYHFFMKCFWNSEFSFKANTVINYDWYLYTNCVFIH